MNEIGRYLVGRRRTYRGHQPGSIFEARLEPAAEARAIARGDISLIERLTPTLQPGSFTFPRGWLNSNRNEEVQ